MTPRRIKDENDTLSGPAVSTGSPSLQCDFTLQTLTLLFFVLDLHATCRDCGRQTPKWRRNGTKGSQKRRKIEHTCSDASQSGRSVLDSLSEMGEMEPDELSHEAQSEGPASLAQLAKVSNLGAADPGRLVSDQIAELAAAGNI